MALLGDRDEIFQLPEEHEISFARASAADKSRTSVGLKPIPIGPPRCDGPPTEMVRAAYTLRSDDDDWSQAGALVREVMDDAARERLVHNIVHHVTDGVKEPVLSRVVEYWYNIDRDIGKRVEDGIRAR
ncbi:hypothetical protein MFM001_01270 [Mycobacterium sp. MFM001]|nr:hypothetical protein MFM001_01270 [Mycobacterium sp. MFM001]